MALGPTLSLRLITILMIGFVLLQALLWAAMALPPRGDERRPYNLPSPPQVEAMAQTLETADPARREVLLQAFGGSLYSVTLQAGPPPGTTASLAGLAAPYVAGLPGRAVSLSTRRPVLGRLVARRPRLARIFAPVSLSVSLADGSRLAIDSGNSDIVRAYLRGRALLGVLGGLAVLAFLALAVRQTTEPLVRLSQSVRRFASDLEAPDLPVKGPPELRELSAAFNEMKARIGGLMAERTRVLAGVAHDMRTYLTRLRLRTELIEDPAQRAKAAADLDEMTALLDDTLLFARQDAGPALELSRLDLGAELRAFVALRTEMGDAVTLTPPAQGLAVRASPLALRRMLANLVDNGLRHGERVTIAAWADSGTVQVTVADDGPGVPAEALGRLGEPFGRLDPSRDRQSGGAGLGLAIVRALAERQGATVQFANPPDGGFRVTLAFAREPGRAAERG